MKTKPPSIGPWVRRKLRKKAKCAKHRKNPTYVRSFYRCDKKKKFVKNK